MEMKASELVEFAKKHLGDGYVYGTFGQVYTQSLAKQKDAQYAARMGANYYFSRCARWFGKSVCDCVGLFKWYIFGKLGVKYQASWDVSADGSYTAWCKERGSISTMIKQPGIAVYMPGHIGIYVGNGKVIEARGADYGIVETKLADRPFTKWGKLNWLTYDLPAEVPPKPPTPATPAQTGIITGNTVNVRSGAGTTYSILGVVMKGDKVTMLAQKNGWWEIKPGKWVSGKYIKA